MMLIVEPDENPRWRIDSSYAAYLDMKNHTGIYMTISERATYTASFEQKHNTKSSIEAELFGIDDAMVQFMCTQYFMTNQRRYLPTTIYL